MLIEMLAAAAVVSGGGAAIQSGEAQARGAPRGDYRASCYGEYVNRGRLYADCRDNRGRVRGTSIELNRCTAFEIRNNDGLLVCGPNRGQYEDRPGGPGRPGGPDRPGGGWGGGGRESVTVYRDADFRGASVRFDSEMPNLANTGFNDVISSMRFQGEWEVCTDAYFRGQCVTFRDDIRNLRNSGLNDRISSLRPVRRGGPR
ncbi:MAG: beta/gamma crystallin-related protein [Brevundimonas sp.]|uniref:beta/gamma crystallin-related protein n=1 Tax=Brevundimonas sp. TaxID=1871086 RepID=UPI00271A1F45|nr:beta/gamma crystallin-related protein [Brevundimonas sp.]MDO9588297.1 beta/gamma crystallin-related protein [Brevundimonas sp.]MDP3368499.1 beta/gamma crystallin-related protein [Brevundimonas sp.]MDP3656812.1 beta/gamma crystallin-related protein [Brevundimonas sp.]MDZ4109750.1 beta/gamma crystallin-related protein [Brevundimonas sp.]